MSLQEIIQDIKKIRPQISLDQKERSKIDFSSVENGIVYPDNFPQKEDSIKISDHNHTISGVPSRYHIRISSFPKILLEKTEPVLLEFMKRAKQLQLQEKTARVNYGVYWTPSDFEKETSLQGLDNQETRVTTSLDREGFDNIEAQSHSSALYVTVNNKCRRKIKGLMDSIKLESVQINLLRQDIDRVKNSKESSAEIGYLRNALSETLQKAREEQEKILEVLGYQDYKQEAEKRMTMIDKLFFTIPLGYLSSLEGLLRKPLIDVFNQMEESAAFHFVKPYSKQSARRLQDLQIIAQWLAETYPAVEERIGIYSHTNAHTETEAHYLPSLTFPAHSHVMGFGIKENEDKTSFSNEMLINRSLPNSKDIHFWCRASVDNPRFLELQEFLCEAFAIQFK